MGNLDSDDKINKIIQEMLDNADEDGWCHIPDGLSEEEQAKISKVVSTITMRDRIDTLMDGINQVIEYIDMVDENIEEYETMDRIKVKKSLLEIKEDSETLLLDLHSSDRISNFFKIDMVSEDNEEAKNEAEKAKMDMEELIEVEFKDSLYYIGELCKVMVNRADKMLSKVEKLL